MLRVLPALLCVVAIAAACGTSKTQPPAQDAPGVRVDATIDWGRAQLIQGRGRTGSVLDATRSVAKVRTSYGGRYVAAIAGQAGDGTSDWIFWVNGLEAPIGAAETRVRGGDVVWWDRHRWAGRVHVPAVVAAWPRPVTRGLDGPNRGISADPPLAATLRALGVETAAPAATSGPRVLVDGAAELIDRDPGWRAAMAAPEAAGLTAWIDETGVRVWDARRGRDVAVPSAVAVIVATTDGFAADDPPIIAVVGVTAAAAKAAAQLLSRTPAIVERAAAVCLDEAGTVVCRGGLGRTDR